MLGRASICIEPAAQIVLRRCELPTRSQRVLGRAFWQNGGNELEVPSWWPLYLNSIRKVPQAQGASARKTGRRSLILDPPSTLSTGPPHSGSDQFESFMIHPTSASRQFSHSIPPHFQNHEGRHQITAEAEESLQTHDGYSVHAAEGAFEEGSSMDQDQQELEAVQWQPDQDSIGSPPISGDGTTNQDEVELRKLLKSDLNNTLDHIAAYHEVWRLFVSLPVQEELAPDVLRYLANSTMNLDRRRALQCYAIIPEGNRGKDDYDAAVAVAVNESEFTRATAICEEALRRGFGQECPQILLLDCLQKAMWTRAATTFKLLFPEDSSIKHGTEPMLRLEDVLQNSLKLPSSLAMLFRHLEGKGSVRSASRDALHAMLSFLLDRMCRSTRIMGLITGEGFLHLLDCGENFQLSDSDNYFKALHSLHEMRTQRNRVDLALMIYRHLRFKHPAVIIPEESVTQLLELSLEARLPEATFEYLFDQIRAMSREPSPYHYKLVLTALARQGNSVGVHRQFNNLTKVHGAPRSLSLHTPNLYVYAIIGDVENTQAQFTNLSDQHGLSPNVYCWNILIYAHSRSSHPETAFEVFDEMQESGVCPDGYSIGTLLGIASKLGDKTTVFKMVELAMQLGITTSTSMIDSIVDVHCRNNEMEEAEKLVESATRRQTPGSPVRMWNILLKHYAFRADSQSVLRTQKSMREFGVRPDDMTFAALMTAFVVLGRTNQAAEIVRKIHFSGVCVATSFHYSILLHGFANEDNRDQVNIIYNEMLQRFGKVTPSARLVMLQMQARRGRGKPSGSLTGPEQTALVLEKAMGFLEETLEETTTEDLASKSPLPGFDRQSGARAIPLVYMDFLARNFISNDQIGHAEHLIERFEALVDTKYLNMERTMLESIELLTTRIRIATELEQWFIVDETWDLILRRAIARGISIQDRSAKLNGPTEQVTNVPNSSNSVTLELGTEFKSMIPDQAPHRPLEVGSRPILPARRFDLDIPFSRYIHALDLQRRHSDIVALVAKLESLGFDLSGRNWNGYVQVLSKATLEKHQLLAFETFDQKLLPNAQSRANILRGKWIDENLSSDSYYAGEEGRTGRRFWEKIHPEKALPTYYTVIYLTALMLKFLRQAAEGDGTNLQTIKQKFLRTVTLLQSIPYRRDRVQGVLLRGRRPKGDKPLLPREYPRPDKQGLLAGTSFFAHIPAEDLLDIESALAPIPDDELVRSSDALSSTIATPTAIGERIYGEIYRGALFRDKDDRYENSDETAERIARETAQALKVQRLIRRDIEKPRFVASPETGDPLIDLPLVPGEDHPMEEEEFYPPIEKAVSYSDSKHQETEGERLGLGCEPAGIRVQPTEFTQSPQNHEDGQLQSSDETATPLSDGVDHHNPEQEDPSGAKGNEDAPVVSIRYIIQPPSKIRSRYNTGALVRRIVPGDKPRSSRDQRAWTINRRRKAEWDREKQIQLQLRAEARLEMMREAAKREASEKREAQEAETEKEKKKGTERTKDKRRPPLPPSRKGNDPAVKAMIDWMSMAGRGREPRK